MLLCRGGCPYRAATPSGGKYEQETICFPTPCFINRLYFFGVEICPMEYRLSAGKCFAFVYMIESDNLIAQAIIDWRKTRYSKHLYHPLIQNRSSDIPTRIDITPGFQMSKINLALMTAHDYYLRFLYLLKYIAHSYLLQKSALFQPWHT